MGLCNGAMRWGCRTGLQDVEQDRSCRLGSVQSLCSAAQFPLLACHLEAADSSPPVPHRLRAHHHRHTPRPCLGPVPMSRVALPGGLGTPRSAPAARGAAARGAVRAVGNPPCSPVPDPVPIPRCRAVVARVGRACGGAQGTRAGGKADSAQAEHLQDVPAAVCLGKGSLGGASAWQDPALVFTETWGQPGRGAGLLRSAVLEKWSDTSLRMTGLTSGEAPTGSVKNLPSWPWGHCPAVLLGSPSPGSRHPLRWHRTGSCTRSCPQRGACPCRAAPQRPCLCTLCDRHAQEIFQC